MQIQKIISNRNLLFLLFLSLFLISLYNTPGETQMKDTRITGRATAANTTFGLNLFARLHQSTPAENVFFSPASVLWCLSMVLNGAEGQTKDELAAALHVTGLKIQDLNAIFRDWKQSLSSIDPKVEIEVANSIWSRRGVGIRQEFITLNQTYFGSDVTELDFNNPQSLSIINSWVKNKTRGKIEKIVDQISPDSVLFLINAIYFNGKWTREFDVSRTKPDRFTTLSGTQKQIPMMRQRGTYSYKEQKDFQAVSLPYGNERLSMYVFLPSEASNLKTFRASFTAENWQNWMAGFETAEGEIALPRFNVAYEVEMKQALKSLGIRAAFDPQQADFGAMIRGASAYISGVKHKAMAEITEEGTVAAAATSTEMRVVSMLVPQRKFQMIVNRPFLFAIRDNTSGLILFIGSVADPS